MARNESDGTSPGLLGRLTGWAFGRSAAAEPERRVPTGSPRARLNDQLVEHFRRAFELDDNRAAKLSLIRRSAIYACVGLRADMLSGLPLVMYRKADDAGGRSGIDLRDPRQRLGMPSQVGGRRMSDMGRVERVDDHPLMRLLRAPNPDWTGRDLLRMTETGLGIMGEAHWQLHGRDGISYVKHGRLMVKKPKTAEEREQYRTVAGWALDGGAGPMGKGQDLAPEEVLWLRYPDPEDPDYGALPPSSVARMGADSYDDAMRSNRDIFRRGLRADGIATPSEEFAGQFDSENVHELQAIIDRSLSGTGANHGVRALPYPFNFATLNSISPKDAEFVALMEFAIEDVARAYRVPIEMVGGTRRTYQNNEVADRAFWQRALEPEACWLAETMTAKLLPLFGLEPGEYFLGFDMSGVVALQEDEAAAWARDREALGTGLKTINEVREAMGLEAVPWGDAWWAPGGLMPVSADGVVADEPMDDDEPDAADGLASLPGPQSERIAELLLGLDKLERAATDEGEADDSAGGDDDAADGLRYGGDEHRALMRKQDEALRPHERRMEREATKLLEAQRDSILDKLKDARAQRGPQARLSLAEMAALFGRARWVREFRRKMLPHMLRAADSGGADATGSVGEDTPERPNGAANAMRRQAQRFARQVNETTWDELRLSIAEAIEDGETIPQIADRVSEVMGARIRSTPTVIARTEAHTAYQTGGLEYMSTFGGRYEKEWASALDDRVRKDHRDAHGQRRAMDENFDVGGSRGPAPGRMGAADQDIQCRCSMRYVRARRSRAKEQTSDAIPTTDAG